MADIQSCGFLVYREEPKLSFLLMQHSTRWDLPKGHVDPGETEMECALRETVRRKLVLNNLESKLMKIFGSTTFIRLPCRNLTTKPRQKTTIHLSRKTEGTLHQNQADRTRRLPLVRLATTS